MVSFRLGGADGVSVEAAKWKGALQQLGFAVHTVAGAGPVDHLIPGLAAGPDLNQHEPPPVDSDELHRALQGADLVVVENLLSLPLNPLAAAAVARALRGRPAILHHHDLPWQRARFAGFPPPPDDRAWRHVTINDHSGRELAARGITAVTIPNAFDPNPPAGDRDAVRRALGLGNGHGNGHGHNHGNGDCQDHGQVHGPADDTWLVLQPTRAIPRKNVPAGLALAEAVGATFWLLGPAEEGYGPELAELLAGAKTPTHHGPAGPVSETSGIEHAYAACDVVVFPSLSEGFGNPPVEAALHRRPVAVGPYQVGRELRARGFRWWDATDYEAVRHFLRSPDTRLLDHNEHIARTQFSLEHLPAALSQLLGDAGWAL